MIRINTRLKSIFFIGALIAALLTAPSQSFAGNPMYLGNAGIYDPSQTNAPPQKPKGKKKAKAKQKMTTTKLIAVPASVWGANGIIFSVETNGVAIQYDCADGQIEQRLMMNEQGNFAANGFHIRQRGGPIRENDKQARQNARYEGKISGNTMTLKVILTETSEVIGNFTLDRGKTPRMHRCL